MRIREESTIDAGTREERQRAILDAIEDLEAQRESGEFEDAAYFLRKRALVKML